MKPLPPVPPAPPEATASAQPLQFVRCTGNQPHTVTLSQVPPTRTLLEVLREDLHCHSVKEGCNEGDCGACTVVLGERVDNGLRYSAVNSCIRMAHSVQGMAVWTAQDLPEAQGLAEAPLSLHPVQQSMLNCHASQCGFCTPGIVMSLFALYQQAPGAPGLTRAQATEALSGNLCRCTGYRAVVDAAVQMHSHTKVAVNESEVLQQLELLSHNSRGLEAKNAYISPRTLVDLLHARRTQPQAQLVAGCTDVGLWVNKLHLQFEQVLDVSGVEELRRVEDYAQHIAIGAAVNLNQAFAALTQDRAQLRNFATRFAGLPVRNAGTLGGNVANGSPIGDSMPLLIALQAHVVLMRELAHPDGRTQLAHRELALEDFYTGYRKNVLQADEVLAWIKVPKPLATELCRVYKVSKRFEDDISAVCLAVVLHVEGGVVRHASIGAGGVAATPVRALKTQAALVGQPWTQATVTQAMQVLRAEFTPISDMRASAAYRTQVLGNLLQRFWLETQGGDTPQLGDLDTLTEVLADGRANAAATMQGEAA